jgi:hypothetical protein
VLAKLGDHRSHRGEHREPLPHPEGLVDPHPDQEDDELAIGLGGAPALVDHLP